MAHTTKISMNEHPYNYYLVMRKFFKWIKFGKVYGLNDSDISIIRKSNVPESLAKNAMKPYLQEIEQQYKSGYPSSAEIGRLLNEMQDAELAAKDGYCRKIVAELSAQGQSILKELYESKLKTSRSVNVTDFAALATDVPSYVLKLAEPKEPSQSNKAVQVRVSPPEYANKIIVKGQK